MDVFKERWRSDTAFCAKTGKGINKNQEEYRGCRGMAGQKLFCATGRNRKERREDRLDSLQALCKSLRWI